MNGEIEKVITAKTVRINSKIRIFILFAILMGLGLTVYSDAMSGLIVSVLHREGSSHGVFVPFVSVIFLWLRWERIKKIEPEYTPIPGAIMLTGSFLMLYIARGTTENALPVLSFLIMAAGLIMALFGAKVFKEVSFPLFFLMTMIPLPKPVYAQIAEWMRATSTSGSTWILQLSGVPFIREGYNIHLPNIDLYVAKSCSGIRYLISYFVFGLAYAFIYKKSIKSRILVVIATIPISVIAGVLRLDTIFLSAYYIGAFMAGRQPHILLSWSVFALVLTGAILMDLKLFHSQHHK